jgi:D-arabinonate dehydratase
VHTDAGVIGECFNGNDDELQGAIIRMIHDEMAPRLVGQPVMGVTQAWELMRASTEPFLRDRRVALRAMALVDSALHHAAGKLAGLPLHVMWGNARADVPVVALGGYYRETHQMLVEMLRREVAVMLPIKRVHPLELALRRTPR